MKYLFFVSTAFLLSWSLSSCTSEQPSDSPSRPSEEPIEEPISLDNNWVRFSPDASWSVDQIKDRLELLKNSSIGGVIISEDDEGLFEMAADAGLKTQLSFSVLKQDDPSVTKSHSDWLMVNRDGMSSVEATKNGSVWLCPSNKEVRSHLTHQVEELSQKEYFQVINLDHLMYPMIGDPREWKRPGYDAEKDYCYCDECRSTFWSQSDSEPFPDDSLRKDIIWKRFRTDLITSLADTLIKVAQNRGKYVSCSVMPFNAVGVPLSNQDFSKWSPDQFIPEVDLELFDETESFVGMSVNVSVRSVRNQFPVVSGLRWEDFTKPEKLRRAYENVRSNGGIGVCMSGNPTVEQISQFHQIVTETDNPANED